MPDPQCSVCGRNLELLPSFGRSTVIIGASQDELKQWRGNVCTRCRYVFCPLCLSVSPPPSCPACKNPTKPTMQSYLYGVPRKEFPISDKKIIEFYADSMEDARDRIKTQIPEGYSILDFLIFKKDKLQHADAYGQTQDAAFNEAKKKVPAGATIVACVIKQQAQRKSFDVFLNSVHGEEDAISKARQMSDEPFFVNNVVLVHRSRKGLLGIGEKPSQWAVEITTMCLAQVTFKDKVKVTLTISTYPHSILTVDKMFKAMGVLKDKLP
jgi:hypothetical protein